MTMSAPSPALRPLFEQMSTALVAEITRDIGFGKTVVFGAALTCAIAAVSGLARLFAPPHSDVALFVISFGAGTLYGIVRVATSAIRYVDKRTGQSVTVALPLVFGFGLGLLGFGVDAVLSLIPIPSIVPDLVLAAGLSAVWFVRYRRAPPLRFDGVPMVGVSLALLGMADPALPSTIMWNDPKALPPDFLAYEANVTRPDAIRVTYSLYQRVAGPVLQVVAEFPTSYVWIHPSDQITLSGLTLDVSRTASGVLVRATNTHAPASGRLFQDALRMTLAACKPAAAS
jgi:hypothetical protein